MFFPVPSHLSSHTPLFTSSHELRIFASLFLSPVLTYFLGLHTRCRSTPKTDISHRRRKLTAYIITSSKLETAARGLNSKDIPNIFDNYPSSEIFTIPTSSVFRFQSSHIRNTLQGLDCQASEIEFVLIKSKVLQYHKLEAMVDQDFVPSLEANSASDAEHAWLRVRTMPDRYRIAVKQQAVDDGLKYAEDILGAISRSQGDKKPQDLVGAPIFKLLAETGE